MADQEANNVQVGLASEDLWFSCHVGEDPGTDPSNWRKIPFAGSTVVGKSTGDATGVGDKALIDAAITAAGAYGNVVFNPGETYVTYGDHQPLTGQTWTMWGVTIQRTDQIRTTGVNTPITEGSGAPYTLDLGTDAAAEGWVVGMTVSISDGTNTAATDYETRIHAITAVSGDDITLDNQFIVGTSTIGLPYHVVAVGKIINLPNSDGVPILEDITFLGGILDGNSANNTFLTKWDLQNELYINKGYSNFTSYSLTVKNATADAIVYGGNGTRFINPRTFNSNGHALHAAGVGVTSFNGTQTGTPSATVMEDSSANFGNGWNTNQLVGQVIENTTDSATGTIVSNTAFTATVASMSSGQWDIGDGYDILNINGEGAIITNPVLIDSKQAYNATDGDVTGHGEGAISYSVNTLKTIYENLQVDGCLFGGIGGLSDTTNSDTQFFNGFIRNITEGNMIQMSSIGANNAVFDGLQFEGQNDSGAGSVIGVGTSTATNLNNVKFVNCAMIGCYTIIRDANNVIFDGNTWEWDGNAGTRVIQIRGDSNNVYINDRISTRAQTAVNFVDSPSNITIEGEILDFGRMAIDDLSSGTNIIIKPRKIIEGPSLESGTNVFPINLQSAQVNRVIIRDINFEFSTLAATQPLIQAHSADGSLITGCTMLHTLGGTGDAVSLLAGTDNCNVVLNFLEAGLTIADAGTGNTITPNYGI